MRNKAEESSIDVQHNRAAFREGRRVNCGSLVEERPFMAA
jgi:hypothetical protein